MQREDYIKHSHLAVSINHWAQKFPGASPSVHTNHTQDLQEAHAAQGWRGEDVALRPCCYHCQRCHKYYEVCEDVQRGKIDKSVIMKWDFTILTLTHTQTQTDIYTHTNLWHRRASWQISAVPAIPGICSNSLLPRSWWSTPTQTPQSSQTPVQQDGNNRCFGLCVNGGSRIILYKSLLVSVDYKYIITSYFTLLMQRFVIELHLVFLVRLVLSLRAER